VLINSAVVFPPPVPGYLSFLLDLDVSRDSDTPQSDNEMFALLREIGVEKDSVFEACITEKARGLFK
jgi:uncharacterized protein (TIGR04255 family)